MTKENESGLSLRIKIIDEDGLFPEEEASISWTKLEALSLAKSLVGAWEEDTWPAWLDRKTLTKEICAAALLRIWQSYDYQGGGVAAGQYSSESVATIMAWTKGKDARVALKRFCSEAPKRLLDECEWRKAVLSERKELTVRATRPGQWICLDEVAITEGLPPGTRMEGAHYGESLVSEGFAKNIAEARPFILFEASSKNEAMTAALARVENLTFGEESEVPLTRRREARL